MSVFGKQLVKSVRLTATKSSVIVRPNARAFHSSFFIHNESSVAAAAAVSTEAAAPTPAPSAPKKSIDDATVRRIVDDILNLDFVEMNQLLKICQGLHLIAVFVKKLCIDVSPPADETKYPRWGLQYR